MTKRALITGITGQDGSYLADLLLGKGYEVHGIKRRSSSFNTDRIDHLYQDPHESEVKMVLHYGDMTDATNLIRIIQEVQPDEIYNLGEGLYELRAYACDVEANCNVDEAPIAVISLRANQLRLYFASFAYVLMHALRRLGLAGTELARAQATTIRLKLLKIGTRLRITVRKVWLSFSETYPYANVFARILANLRGHPLWASPG